MNNEIYNSMLQGYPMNTEQQKPSCRNTLTMQDL